MGWSRKTSLISFVRTLDLSLSISIVSSLKADEYCFLVEYRCPHCGHFNPRRKDPLLPGGQRGGSDPAHPHRRVQSMHAPSPLQRSFPQFEQSVPSSPEMQERRGKSSDEEEGEESEESQEGEEVVLKEGGEGSSARIRSQEQPTRRRGGALAVREEDKMDTED